MGISSCCLVMWLYLHCKNISSKVTRLVSDSTDKTKCDLQEYLSKKSFEAWYGVKVTELEKISLKMRISWKFRYMVATWIYYCMFQWLSVEALWLGHGSWEVHTQQTENHWFLIASFRKKANKSKQEWLK